MMGVFAVDNHTEGSSALTRLIEHCRLLGPFEGDASSARRRLEAAVGQDQARLLLSALTGDHAFVRRARRCLPRARSAP